MSPRGEKFRYRRNVKQRGEIVKLRRYTGTGSTRVANDYNVRGWIKGFDPHVLIGSIVYGDRHAIILDEDVTAIAFPVPITTSDKIVVRGKELAIGLVDDNSHRDHGTLIAYELKVTG